MEYGTSTTKPDNDNLKPLQVRKAAPVRKAWRWIVKYPLTFTSLVIIGLFLFAGLFAKSLATHDPKMPGYGSQNLAPAWSRSPGAKSSPEYLLGTDWAGRDVYSRLLYGTRTAVALCLLAVPPAVILGVLVGLTAGFAGGEVDNLLMRLTDILSGFPAILFAVLVVFILRDTRFGELMSGLLTLAMAFALVAWVELARLVRAAVLNLKEKEYIEAAYAIGANPRRILFKHILPNCTNLILVWLMAAISKVIILEAMLGYLGIGITPALEGSEFIVTSWGGMFKEGRQLIHANPVMLAATSSCVILVCVSFTFLGDYLRDRFDPRSKALL